MVYLLIAWWIFPWQTVSHNQMVDIHYDTDWCGKVLPDKHVGKESSKVFVVTTRIDKTRIALKRKKRGSPQLCLLMFLNHSSSIYPAWYIPLPEASSQQKKTWKTTIFETTNQELRAMVIYIYIPYTYRYTIYTIYRYTIIPVLGVMVAPT